MKSTLGAGNTFKAGCIYGLSRKWNGEQIIKFPMAATIACTKFPLPFNTLKLEENEEFMKSQ